jgi:hypothetical protein
MCSDPMKYIRSSINAGVSIRKSSRWERCTDILGAWKPHKPNFIFWNKEDSPQNSSSKSCLSKHQLAILHVFSSPTSHLPARLLPSGILTSFVQIATPVGRVTVPTIKAAWLDRPDNVCCRAAGRLDTFHSAIMVPLLSFSFPVFFVFYVETLGTRNIKPSILRKTTWCSDTTDRATRCASCH